MRGCVTLHSVTGMDRAELDTAESNVETYCDLLGSRLNDLLHDVQVAQGELEDLMGAIKYEREVREALSA